MSAGCSTIPGLVRPFTTGVPTGRCPPVPSSWPPSPCSWAQPWLSTSYPLPGAGCPPLSVRPLPAGCGNCPPCRNASELSTSQQLAISSARYTCVPSVNRVRKLDSACWSFIFVITQILTMMICSPARWLECSVMSSGKRKAVKPLETLKIQGLFCVDRRWS